MLVTIGRANTKTFEILVQNINAIIEKECAEQSDEKIKIEPALVRAIIMQESSYKPMSARFEAHKQRDEMYLSHIPQEYKTNELAFMSMGPMQVLYGTARWLGFKGDPYGMMNPYENIKYGVKYLKWLIKKYDRIDYVISSYNWGHPAKKDGVLKNYNNYVKPVLKYYAEFGGVVK